MTPRPLPKFAVLGIDPGKAGGLALLTEGAPLETWKMPDTERDLLVLLEALEPRTSFAVIEQVTPMKGWGASSSWEFGQHYGTLRMALIALYIPFRAVSPTTWQRQVFGKTSGGDKKMTWRAAQERYPDHKITHAIADAIFIARYGYLLMGRTTW